MSTDAPVRLMERRREFKQAKPTIPGHPGFLAETRGQERPGKPLHGKAEPVMTF